MNKGIHQNLVCLNTNDFVDLSVSTRNINPGEENKDDGDDDDIIIAVDDTVNI